MKINAHPQIAFSAQGIFSEWPEFEYRQAQQEMSSLVWEVVERGGCALIEAGTGTGKSLAYLYPLFTQTIQEKGSVVIATYTINLQQQLMEKEIPFLAKILGIPLKAALLLGRGNYLCWRKLAFYRQHPDKLDSSQRRFLLRVLTSAEENLGCLEQLGYSLPSELREKLTSEAETCLRKICPFQGKCFWLLARKEAFAAEVIIVNHHLFFTDLSMRMEREFADDKLVLPPYHYVIFDEAHHVEDVAAEYLGLRLDEYEIERFCKRLLHKEGRWGNGWLVSLRQRLLEKGSDLAFMQRSIAALEMELIPDLLTLENLFRTLFQLIGEGQNFQRSLGEERNYRYTTNLLLENETLNGLVSQVNEAIDQWTKRLSLLIDEMQDSDELIEDTIFLVEAGRFFKRLGASLPLLLDGTDPQFVYWFTLRPILGDQRTIRMVINRVPLQLGDLLYKELFSKVNSAILTSATLAVGNDFTYIKERLGINYLHPSERKEVILESPFDYQKNVLVIISTDLPTPEDPKYSEKISLLLPDLIHAAKGRSLLLFTNKRQMIEVYNQIAPQLKEEGFHLFKQGEKPRNRLLKVFQLTSKSVLFGMDSFWEGVDIPGSQLSNVVIMRLPFRVPTEPLFQAKWEALQQEGKDPFLNLSLPEAVLKFKQGFGRLIRTKTDRGTVIILDQRVTTKRYGKAFLTSIPGGEIIKATTEQIPILIKKWLE
jgi:ATP-dependent DNA helicase DinG